MPPCVCIRGVHASLCVYQECIYLPGCMRRIVLSWVWENGVMMRRVLFSLPVVNVVTMRRVLPFLLPSVVQRGTYCSLLITRFTVGRVLITAHHPFHCWSVVSLPYGPGPCSLIKLINVDSWHLRTVPRLIFPDYQNPGIYPGWDHLRINQGAGQNLAGMTGKPATERGVAQGCPFSQTLLFPDQNCN